MPALERTGPATANGSAAGGALRSAFEKIAACSLLALALASAVGFPAFPAGAADKFLALGTAYRAGTYYPVGQALCERINKDRDQTAIRCLSYETGGSAYNIQALAARELDVAITQSNLAYNAYHGLGEFEGIGPNKGLRTVVNLYDQPLTVSVHKDSGIDSFEKIPGRIINIGNLGSGKRALAEKLLGVMGWGRKDFSKVLELSTSKQVRAFCGREIDVMIETVGIPTPLYKQVEECGGVFLDLPDALRDGFRQLGPFFFDYAVPRSVNANNTHEVRTTGLKILLITRSDVSASVIRSIAASLMSEAGAFQKLHAALSLSTIESMTGQAIHVPLHDGVVAYLNDRIRLSE